MKATLLSTLLLASQFNLLACGGYGDSPGYIAHEWGTFTSVQGADGVQFEWRPNLGADLPKFVHTYLQPNSSLAGAHSAFLFSKGVRLARQRMETPVIYFYAPEEMNVDVRVDFPKGVVTEWFPRVTSFGPSVQTRQEAHSGSESFIEWKNVRVLKRDAQVTFPVDGTKNHYFAARATDANPIAFGDAKYGGIEHEKLLFYRGLGHFEAPLQAGLSKGEDQLVLRNTGESPLAHLFVLAVHQDKAKFVHLPTLGAGAGRDIPLAPGEGLRPLNEVASDLAAQLHQALVQQRLFPKEASAMIETWRDAWFEEPGLRVLYILPRDWTDRVLPLQLDPKPMNLVRVMVGRAEIIPPQKEWELLRHIVQFSAKNPAARSLAVDGFKRIELGRFAEPAIQRVLGSQPNKQFADAAWGLLKAATGEDVPAALAADQR
jgi:hypothetical protein